MIKGADLGDPWFIFVSMSMSITMFIFFHSGNFYILSFINSSDLVFGSNIFLQYWVDILPLGSGTVDPHPNPDPGSQNVSNPMDPDPKQWVKQYYCEPCKFLILLMALKITLEHQYLSKFQVFDRLKKQMCWDSFLFKKNLISLG